jgi:hypothetical protein
MQNGIDAWGEAKILRAADPQAADCFGYSVAVSGDVIVVGVPGDDVEGYNAGAAYVFERLQGESVSTPGADFWGQVKVLYASDAQEEDNFGDSVAVSGDVIVVGAPYEDSGGSDAGTAYVYQRMQTGADLWGQVKILHAVGAQAFDGFGHSVAVSGDVIVVGAPGEDGGIGNPLTNAGMACVFQRTFSGIDNWGQIRTLSASDTQADDQFGYSVAIWRDVIVVGAIHEDGGAGDPVDNAGAAYVFQRYQGEAHIWGEVKILHASDAQAGDMLGHSVAVWGDVIVAGTPWEDGGAGDPYADSGVAYVFQRLLGGTDAWGQAQILHTSDEPAGDRFGQAVAVWGSMIVVGAPFQDGSTGVDYGAAYLYQARPVGKVFLPVIVK